MNKKRKVHTFFGARSHMLFAQVRAQVRTQKNRSKGFTQAPSPGLPLHKKRGRCVQLRAVLRGNQNTFPRKFPRSEMNNFMGLQRCAAARLARRGVCIPPPVDHQTRRSPKERDSAWLQTKTNNSLKIGFKGYWIVPRTSRASRAAARSRNHAKSFIFARGNGSAQCV